MTEDMTFTVVNDEGKEIKCDVLFTFDSDETGKNYIVYTDNTKDENGNLRTMPAVKGLIRSQQMLAAETGVAFWNLYNAMGGEGSMVEMVNSKPAMANYDYTHINFRGGKHIAGLLFDAIIYGKEQYEKRKMYESE